MPRPAVLRLEALLEEHGEAFVRLVTASLQAVLEGEMTAFLGAAAGERTHARTGHRAGHRRQDLMTRTGKVELQVPRDRERRFTTALFDRYAHVEKTFIAMLAGMHARGVTAARVEAMAEALCGHACCARAIEQMRHGLDSAMARFARGSMQDTWPCVVLRAQRTRVVVDNVVRSRVVRLAVGVDREGRTRLLGVDLVMRQRRPDWKGLLRGLKRCGLHGARTVVAGGDDEAPWRAARGTLNSGWLRAIDDAFAYGRAARVATGRGAAPSGTRSLGPRPRWRIARQHAREAAEAQPSALLQDPERGAGEEIASNPRPIDVATTSPARTPVVAQTRSHQHVALAPAPPGPASRTKALLDHRGFVARAAELIGPAIVWGGVGAALVITGVLFWNLDSTGRSPEALAIVPTPASPMHSLPSPVPMASALVSVEPGAATPQPVGSRYQLIGVLAAASADGPGIALIAVDGGSAYAYRVGATVDGDLMLKGVGQSDATLGTASGPATVRLDVTYGAAPANSLRHASAGQIWPAPVAQALLADDGDAARRGWTIAASPQGIPGSAGTVQALPPTAEDLAAQPATDLVPDASPMPAKPSPGRRMRLRR
jgi:hypothetical protein